jgi:hypothetical protein
MSRTHIAITITCLCLVVLAALDGYRRGEANAERIALAGRVDTLTQTVVKYDTLYRDSLVIATRWKTRWDTVRVRDTITIVRNDTTIVYVRRDVADSTINACFAVVRACDKAGAAKDTLVLALRAQLAATGPDPWQRARDMGMGGLIGALIALLLGR